MRRLGTGRRGLGAVLVGVVLAGTSCGLGPQEVAQPIDEGEVPFGLAEPEPTTSTSQPPAGETVTIYLFDGQVAVPVQRGVEEADLGSILEQLDEGALRAEAAKGLRSAFDAGSDTEVLGEVEVSGGVATVDLQDPFGDLDGQDQISAIAQIVLSLTERPRVDQVAFTLDGAPVDVPRADGTSTGDPVSRSDYAGLLRG